MHYDDARADAYDSRYAARFAEAEATAAFLAGVARPPGPVLELGVGTGRLALLLAAQGTRRPRGGRLDRHGRAAAGQAWRRAGQGRHGRLRQGRPPGRRPLRPRLSRVQHPVRARVAGAAGPLLPGRGRPPHTRGRVRGRGVRAGSLPTRPGAHRLRRRRRGRPAPGHPPRPGHPGRAGPDHDDHDRAASSCGRSRSATPPSPRLDLMARLAGLRLRERWGGWAGEPFTEASSRHVSVYELATGG